MRILRLLLAPALGAVLILSTAACHYYGPSRHHGQGPYYGWSKGGSGSYGPARGGPYRGDYHRGGSYRGGYGRGGEWSGRGSRGACGRNGRDGHCRDRH